MLTQKMARVAERLGSQLGERVTLVSLSINPEHDGPQQLADYTKRQDAERKGWLFLTGTPANVDKVMAAAFRMVRERDEDGSVAHVMGIFSSGPMVAPSPRFSLRMRSHQSHQPRLSTLSISFVTVSAFSISPSYSRSSRSLESWGWLTDRKYQLRQRCTACVGGGLNHPTCRPYVDRIHRDAKPAVFGRGNRIAIAGDVGLSEDIRRIVDTAIARLGPIGHRPQQRRN
jgi:hypothetical protein